MRYAASVLAVALGFAASAGCAPKPLKSALPTRTSPELEAARHAARAGQHDQAEALYESVIDRTDDPIFRDLGLLELGQLFFDIGQCDRAEPLSVRASESREPSIAQRARLLRGVCRFQVGDASGALTWLTPLAREPLPQEERQLLLDTVLLASEVELATKGAVLALSAVQQSAPKDPVEQKVRELLRSSIEEQLPTEELQALYQELPRDSLAWQLVAARQLNQAIEESDAETTARLLDELRPVSPLTDAAMWAAMLKRAELFLNGNPFAVGVLLPLSGRGREVGDRLLRGIRIAAANDPAGPELMIQDTAGSADQARQATEVLLRDHQVVAILGPVSTASSRAAADVAQSAHVPLVTFNADPTITDQGRHVFRFFFTPDEELRALVKEARGRGLREFAVLHPAHRYGRALRDRYREEIDHAGGRFCGSVEYPAETKSFASHVQQVLALNCRAVLIADISSRVALIAPTLAAEGSWAAPAEAVSTDDKRYVTLLLPSLAWAPSLVSQSSRYLQGTLVASPYDPNQPGPTSERFRTSYVNQFAAAPDMFAAYGHDAYRLLSFAIASGASTRAQLRDALIQQEFSGGVTAIGTLSRERIPGTRPIVFELVGDALEHRD